MTAPEQPEEVRPIKPKPVLGFLICKTCKKVIPYQGLPDMSLADAPRHRCSDYTVQPFTRWSEKDPRRSTPVGQVPPLPEDREYIYRREHPTYPPTVTYRAGA